MRTDLQAMPIYTPPSKECLNLANNENFYIQWHDELGDRIEAVAQKLPFHQYGSSEYGRLRQAYANYLGLPPEQVLSAPGSDSLIPILINALTEQSVVTFDKDFFRYGQQAHILRRKQIKVPIESGVDGLIEAVRDNKAELIIFSNPNNPLGLIQERDALVKLLSQTQCYVAIDEAYAEYSGESVVDLISEYPKLIVLRTMSKAWGLARLRIGFLVANADIISFIRSVQGPFVMSDLNTMFAATVLEYESMMRKSVADTLEIRNGFAQYLRTHPNITVHPSSTNFIYVEVPDAKATAAGVLKDGVAIAAFGPNGLRITIGTDAQMEQLKYSLAKNLLNNEKK